MNRGYSWLNVRTVDEDKRVIEGIATTPSVARDGDVLVTEGIQYKLPIPFLYRHSEPFGNVVEAQANKDGIRVRVQIAPAGVSAKIDEYWNLVKSGTVRGLSIGWRTLEESFDKTIGGFRILRSEWLELSAVPVPADANATITSVRSAYEAAAASGNGARKRDRAQNTNPPGVSGPTKGKAMKGLKEKIALLETSIETNRARMTEIVEARDADGRKRMNDEEAAEYDPLATEVEEDEKELRRLRALESQARTAAPVQAQPRLAPAAPGLKVEKVKLEPGMLFTRAVIARIRGMLDMENPARLADKHYRDTPEVAMYLRAIVDPADTTTAAWAGDLVPAAGLVSSEFIDVLRPATLIGRIPGLLRVPFNVNVPIGTADATYRWVGEGANKPVGAGAVSKATLGWAKASGITVMTDELARFSPVAEGIIRRMMIAGCVKFLDTQFVDENIAAVSNVSPASILNAKSAVAAASGTTASAFRVDLNKLVQAFLNNNQDPTGAVILMGSTTAMALGAMVNDLGGPEFPNLTMTGGSINGIPVVASNHVGDRLVLLNAGEIAFADDGNVKVDISREASLEMNTLPTTGEESPLSNVVMHSMFQRNEIAIRVERYINWKKARTTSAEWISGCAYTPA